MQHEVARVQSFDLKADGFDKRHLANVPTWTHYVRQYVKCRRWFEANDALRPSLVSVVRFAFAVLSPADGFAVTPMPVYRLRQYPQQYLA